ncbi:hypothetical protein PJI16_01030 [Nitrospira sp. MA-1]|nr:hypothetical protein [Nitrospira sp. MA-1]
MILSDCRARGNWKQDQKLLSTISQWAEISLKNQITEKLSVSLDYTYTNVNLDLRNEENFTGFYARVGSPWGLGRFLQGSYIAGKPDPDPFNSTIDTSSLENFLILNGKISYQIYKKIHQFLLIEHLTDSN